MPPCSGYPVDGIIYLCQIWIRPPVDSIITLTFNVFDLFNDYICLIEYAQLDVSTSDGSISTYIYCALNRPTKMSVRANQIVISYTSYCTNPLVPFRAGINISYTISLPKNTDLLMLMNLNSPNNKIDVNYKMQLISPIFQINQSSCLTVIFTAQSSFMMKLGYLTKGNYEERLLHRNVDPIVAGYSTSVVNVIELYSLQRTIPFIVADEQQFVLILEANSSVPGNAIIMETIQLSETECTNSVTSWSGTCNFNQDYCGFVDQSSSGYSWSPFHINTNNGFRSEFFGLGEISILQSPPFNSSALIKSSSCALSVATYFTSFNVFLNFSLLQNGTVFNPPVTILPTSSNGINNDYIIHLLEGSSSLSVLQITASQYLTGFYEDDYVLINSIRPLKCSPVESGNQVIMSNNISCKPSSSFLTCGYQLGSDWSDISTGSTNALVFSNTTEYTRDEYFYMDNVVLTPFVSIEQDTLLSFNVHFLCSPSNFSLLDIYRTSSVGAITSHLQTYSGQDQNYDASLTDSLCLPRGQFQLAFVAHCGNALNGFKITISNVLLNDANCTYVELADDNCIIGGFCSDPVLSLSPQLSWKDTIGNAITFIGDAFVAIVYDVSGIVIFPTFDKPTNAIVYVMAPGQFTLSFSLFSNDEICYLSTANEYPFFVPPTIRISSNISGELVETYETFALNETVFNDLSSYAVIQIDIPYSVILCESSLGYSVATNDMDEYSLQVISNWDNAENITAQWISNVYNVNTTNMVYLYFDVQLTSTMQIQMYQELNNGTTFNSSIFTSGSSIDKRIVGQFDLALETNVSMVQFVFYMSVNGTVHQVRVEILPYKEQTQLLKENSVCDFTDLNNCGYEDASQQEIHWVLVSQVNITGTSTTNNLEPVADAQCLLSSDGGEYTGILSTTISGRTCQQWSSQTPNVHPYGDINFFPDFIVNSKAILTNVSNFCRNPTFDGTFDFAPWCYTTDTNQSWEYCLIPFCRSNFMEAVFGASLDTAVLIAPILQFNASTCLQFQYTITSPKIVLNVSWSFPNTSLQSQFKTFQYQNQTNASDWNAAQLFTLNPMIHNGFYLVQFTFAAVKIGFTEGLDSVAVTGFRLISNCYSEANGGYYAYGGPRLSDTEYKQLVLNDTAALNMVNITMLIGHQQQQLIYSCQWNGSICNENLITTELTDMGLCYTFNADANNFLLSDKTGPTYGLRLTLNAEQYENVQGYSTNNGIKIHVRDQADIPQVLDSGFAVSTGFQTIAPLDYSTMTSLEAPWGKCNSKPYIFYNSNDSYTTAKCKLECQTKAMKDHCDCKNIFMPGFENVCNLNKYLSCVQNGDYRGLCTCPDACNVTAYETSLSFSQLSILDMQQSLLLNGQNVTTHFLEALEIANRVDDITFATTISSLIAISDSQQQLQDFIYDNVLNQATSVPGIVLVSLTSFVNDVNNEIIVNGNILLQNFTQCYQTNVNYLIQSLSEQLKSTNQNLFQTQLILQQFLSGFANQYDYDQVNESLSQIDLLNSLLTLAESSLQSAAHYPYCPSSCLQTACSSTLLIGLLTSYSNNLESLMNVAQSTPAYLRKVSSGIINDIQFIQVKLYTLSDCINNYNTYLSTFENFLQTIDLTIPTVDMSVSGLIMSTLSSNGDLISNLLNQYITGNMTKLEMSNIFIESTGNQVLLNVQNTLSNLDSSVTSQITSIINTMESTLGSVYTQMMLNLAQLQTFMASKETHLESFARNLMIWMRPQPMFQTNDLVGFQLSATQSARTWPSTVNLTTFANSSSLVIVSILQGFNIVLKQALLVLQSDITSAQQTLISNVNQLSTILTAFNQSATQDDSFISQNFLKVDIFFGQLTCTSVDQSPGYDSLQFFSDLGGCFGLFLGGSLLSFFEFFDLLIYNLLIKFSSKKSVAPTKINVLPMHESVF